MAINYLSANDIRLINVFQITNYSPKEQIGIKDSNALQMAISQPYQEVFGLELYPTIADKAAILIINLIQKHPFYNANKRTALMALDIFLQYNGYQIHFKYQEGIDLTLYIATNKTSSFEELKSEISKIIASKIGL